ncbi:hypothetical protein JTE90_027299 [Oedothorax gibbosus]|uniref:VOC domain-containing protein n=1 Tax=Oedothorax gibbosus TaxID=931172 RepID=A0AAV6W3S0_9ARAC|nr:hypothetical protein JTE90_027299 [Oedothorax gibbosus]
MSTRRILHYVLKIGNRKETIEFYTKVMGMKVLRHEEFEEGCKATCNGPYDGKWSKTMIGYGAEDNHFVLELTYNYGVKSYKMGNGFVGITVNSSDIINNAKSLGCSIEEQPSVKILKDPNGYQYFISDKTEHHSSDPVQKVTLSCSDLKKSIDYWNGLLGLQIYEKKESLAVLGYSDDQCKLELQCQGPVAHEQAFGRVAFSCPTTELEGIQERVKTAGGKILTPLVSLDTPGKATVHVVILADPDGHEICFVGDEAFRELSQVDPEAGNLIEKAIASDKSDEWFAKKGLSKTEKL